MQTASLCFIRDACAKRVRTKSCWRCAEFSTGYNMCNTRNRNCTTRPELRGQRCFRRRRPGATERFFLMPPIQLLVSAGEASGDMYAARLATALKERLDVELFGMGGPQMRAAGVEIVTDYAEVAGGGGLEDWEDLPSLPRAAGGVVKGAGEGAATPGDAVGF